ncbi:MAG: outer membrane protein [Polaribacter sp.]|jgi:outer membrane protein
MKTTRNSLVFAVATLLCMPTTSVNADFVRLDIGISHWAPILSGNFNSGNDASIQTKSDLGINDPSQTSLVFILEHPIPVLPNVKYQTIDLATSGNKTLTKSQTFNGNTYNASSNVSSTFDLSHDNIVLYYEVLDNWVNLDLGVDLKRFDGQVGINGDNIVVDETVPSLYISAKFDLPFTGFYAGANLMQLSSGDNSANDSTFLVGYESNTGLGIEGGVKAFSLDLNNAGNIDTNVEYNGLYLNGFFYF